MSCKCFQDPFKLPVAKKQIAKDLFRSLVDCILEGKASFILLDRVKK